MATRGGPLSSNPPNNQLEMRDGTNTSSRLVPRADQQAVQVDSSPMAMVSRMQKVNAGDHVVEADVQFAENQPEVGFGSGNAIHRASVNSSTPIAQATKGGDEDDDMADVNLTERSEPGLQSMASNNNNPQEVKSMQQYA